jgi:hypothetical protein
MKARGVTGLDADGPLADAVARIVEVRLDELCAFMPQAEDPAQVTALHDMRIAAKRLRYVLELFAPGFGPYAAAAAKEARRLQGVLGEIHDCDMLGERVAGLLEELRERDAREVLRAAGDADELDPALAADAPHADAFRGLETLLVYLRARRALQFERFLVTWRDLQRRGFDARLRFALSERPAPDTATPPSPSCNGRALHDHLPLNPPTP